MAQEVQGRVVKAALGEVEDQTSQPEPVEVLPEMDNVLLARLVGYKDVVDVQWAPKVYIARKVYIVFPPPPFLNPNINFVGFFLIFSKCSPFSTMPQLFSPLPLFLGFFLT